MPGDSAGPLPGVIFFMDGLGIRPAMWEMGQRLADDGCMPTYSPSAAERHWAALFRLFGETLL